jgi:hypothetical protein
MKERTTGTRVFRFRLRSLLVLIAFLGLLLTVVVQIVRLQRAAAREDQLRAEVMRERVRAEFNLQNARNAMDELFARIADESLHAGPLGATRRELWERTLRFYEGMKSNASAPEIRARALQRAKQIRSKLGDDAADTTS